MYKNDTDYKNSESREKTTGDSYIVKPYQQSFPIKEPTQQHWWNKIKRLIGLSS
jgi:hypothetical protein